MFKYKTFLNLPCKTFKLNTGVNILIPGNLDNLKSLCSEITDYFIRLQECKNRKCLYLSSMSKDVESKIELLNAASNYKNIFWLIDGTSSQFMFMSTAEKLTFRMTLSNLSNKYNNLYIMFITDDYSYVQHNRSILIDNPRIIRTFKSYDTYSKFILRGSDYAIS